MSGESSDAVYAELYKRHPDPETGEESSAPITVTIMLIQIDPVYKELQVRNVTLHEVGHEETAFSFEIANDEVTDISFTQEPFVL